MKRFLDVTGLCKAFYLFRTAKVVLPLSMFFGAAVTCTGQGTTGSNATGTKPFWTYLQNREVVSPSSGNVTVTIPLLHLPGRDGHDLDVSMTYNSQSDLTLNEIVVPASPGNGNQPSGIIQYSGGSAHWRWNDPTVMAKNAQFFAVNYQSINCSGNYVVKTSGGASYTFGQIDTGCVQVSPEGSTPMSTATTPIAGDDSQQGVIFDAVGPLGPTAYFPNGKRLVELSNGALDVDANGNYISYTYPDSTWQGSFSPQNTNIVDTLGRRISEVTLASGQQQLQYFNSEGVQQTININFGGAPAPPSITLPAPAQLPTNCTGVGYCFVPGATQTAPFQISSIVFPDGSSYSFQYDSLGDLLKIGYPGGGYTRYEYNYLSPHTYYVSNINQSGANISLSGVNAQLSAKYTCSDTDIPYGATTIPGGNSCVNAAEIKTSYAPTPEGVYNVGNVVTEPDGTTTTYSFNLVNTNPGGPGAPGGALQVVFDATPVELSHTTTDSQNNVLEQVVNTYESDGMHLHSRSTTRLHGDSTLETWSNVATPVVYVNAGNGTTYAQAYAWSVQSLTTADLKTNNLIKREDYTWLVPGFGNAANPYFEALKLSNSLYDPAVGYTPQTHDGYTAETRYGYDETSVVASNVSSSATYSASTQHLTQNGTRGNVTSSLRWSSDGSSWIGSHHVYDDTGNVVQTTDARGDSTYYSFADRWAGSGCLPSGGGPTAAYATNVTNAYGQSASAVYNPCTGTVASKKDANSNTTTYSYWPTTEQVASVQSPDGGLTSICYENTGACTGADTSYRNYTVSTTTMSPDPAVVSQVSFDGLGRTIASEALSDPWCRNNGTETFYNNREWVAQTTFPHCAGAVGASDYYLYNGLGYPTSKQVTGAAARTWTYSGQSVTEQDEMGNRTVSTVDSLGRLVQIMEPNPTNVPTFETDYLLDAANNLRQVDQWGGAKGLSGDRKRTFTYDTLSRLKVANNPEVNTLSYGYDPNGNMVTETDARNITATRTYDSLNRLTQTIYSDGTPTECFIYDAAVSGTSITNPVGRLTADWTQTSASCAGGPVAATLVNEHLVGVSSTGGGSGGYDLMGRLTADLQCPAAPCSAPFPSQYKYNLGGAMTGETLSGLPSGNLTLTHTHDAAARTSLVTSSWSDSLHPATLFEADATTNATQGLPYGPFGLLNGIYGAGSSAFGPATTSRTYDTHGRSQSETDYAAALTSAVSATTARGTIDISMNEQSTSPVNTPWTAQVTITAPYGGDQYSSACSCYATGTLGVMLAGSGAQVFTQDGQGNTTASIATLVASGFTNLDDIGLTASAAGSVITLTNSTNPPLDMVAVSTNPNYFSSPSFVPVVTSNWSGGQTGTGSAVSDSGTLTVTVGTLTPLILSWNNADNTGTLNSRLITAINGSSSYAAVVTASSSGSQVILTAKNPGVAGNLKVTSSVTYNSSTFPASSVAISAVPLSGGVNAGSPHPAMLAYSYSSAAWQDNGSLGSVTDTVMGQQTFHYDTLNRLVGDSISGPASVGSGALSWTYDAFGNRLSQNGTGGLKFSMTQVQATYNGQSMTNGVAVPGVYANRMDGVNHDLSGNVLADPINGQNFYSFDAASRLRTAGIVCYLYNAEGIRTAKGTWANNACGNITAQYILGPGGEQVTELDGLTNNPVWVHTNVFGAGKLLATYDKAGLHFHFTDWLGTNRSQVNANGTIEETCLSLPFGDSLTCTGPGVDATEHHFTGKERDPESGLDYFGARYFQSNNGRWMSPDWAAKAEPIPYAKMGNPQSLNLYGYVENNPLSMADADGHCGAAAPIQCGGDSDAIADKDAGMFEMEAKHAAAQAGEAARKAQKQAQQQTADGAKASAQSAGAVSSQKIGTVWFNAYGGSAAERSAQLAAMSQDLTTTDRGGEMLTALEGRKSGFLGLWGAPKPFDIIQWANPTGSYSTQGGNFIVLDPSQIGMGYQSASGGGMFSLQRIFAHEMGHAAMGNLDNGPGAMNNTNWNENVLMRQLGDFNNRTTY